MDLERFGRSSTCFRTKRLPRSNIETQTYIRGSQLGIVKSWPKQSLLVQRHARSNVMNNDGLLRPDSVILSKRKIALLFVIYILTKRFSNKIIVIGHAIVATHLVPAYINNNTRNFVTLKWPVLRQIGSRVYNKSVRKTCENLSSTYVLLRCCTKTLKQKKITTWPTLQKFRQRAIHAAASIISRVLAHANRNSPKWWANGWLVFWTEIKIFRVWNNNNPTTRWGRAGYHSTRVRKCIPHVRVRAYA